MSSADHKVEDKPDNRPRHEVHRRRRRYPADRPKDNGEIDVFDHRVRPLETDHVDDERAERTA